VDVITLRRYYAVWQAKDLTLRYFRFKAWYMANDDAVHVQGLVKKFGEVKALDGSHPGNIALANARRCLFKWLQSGKTVG
jgi:hypothetical protein